MRNTLKNNWFKLIIVEKSRWQIYLILSLLVFSAVLGYITPKAINNLFSSFDSKTSFESASIFLAIIFITEYLVRVIYQFSVNFYIKNLLFSLRSKCFTCWINSYESFQSDVSHKERYPLGEVLARLMSDTEAVQELVSTGSFAIFIDIVFIVSCLISFISLNTISGITLILAEVVACWLLVWGSKFMFKVYSDVRASTSNMSRVLANILGGLNQSYYVPQNNYSSKKSLEAFDHFLQVQLKANIWDASYYSFAESLYPLLIALLVIILPYSNFTEMAALAVMIDLIQRSIGPIKDATGKVSNIQRARTGINRINEFLNDLSLLPYSKNYRSMSSTSIDTFTLKLNEFYYSDQSKAQFSLRDINLSFKRGERIGIVGLSGCGKSTLLKILAGDILVENAQIALDHEAERVKLDISNVESLCLYKSYIGLVSQDSHVFTRDLKFNITLGIDLEHFDLFWQQVVDKINYLKSWGIKSDSLINPNEISLVKKQLIESLRACFLKKPIILFDEVSSSLDADLELALRQLMQFIHPDTLLIVVAHRIETIIHSDKIILMDRGIIQGSGSHQELLEKYSVYQEFIAQVSAL